MVRGLGSLEKFKIILQCRKHIKWEKVFVKSNLVGYNIGRIVILEFREQNSTVFDDILQFLQQHSDFEKLDVKYQPILSLSGLKIDLSSRKVTCNSQEVKLTVKEYDLLCLLTANRGRVLTYAQIYDKVWGDIPPGSEKDIVGYHICNLRRKLCSLNLS